MPRKQNRAMNLHISDFSSVLELAVTMNIAFVIADYSHSFTKAVADKVCRFDDKIKGFCNGLREKINGLRCDELKHHLVDGHSTIREVEEIKRNVNETKKDIDNKEKALTEEKDTLCQSRCFSFISLYFFLFSLLALFIPDEVQNIPFVENVWFAFISLSFLMVLLLWFCGEKDFMNSVTSNLLVSIGIFIGLLVFIPISLVVYDYSWALPSMGIRHGINTWATPILPLLNFAVYTIAIIRINKQLSRNINDGNNEFVEKINNLSAQITPHLGINRVSAGFDVERTADDVVPTVSPKTDICTPVQKPKAQVKPLEDTEARIKQILATEGACSTSKIAKKLFLNNRDVKLILSSLETRNEVCKTKEGETIFFYLNTRQTKNA